MKKLLFIALLLPALVAAGAVGDITGASIETNGWMLNIWVSGIPTNGTVNCGWLNTSNTITGSEKVLLTVVSPGFDDAGTSNGIIRRLYGGRVLRFPYGVGGQTAGNYVQDVTTNSADGTTLIRLSLTEYVFVNDTVVLSVASGFYSNNAASFTATNGSTETSYLSPVANWGPPTNQVAHSSTMRLAVIGGHWSGRNSRPLRAVMFIVRDTSGNAVTNIETRMATPLTYVSDINISSLTDGNLLRCDFIAYPWVGTNILTTLDNANANLPEYAPLTNACNRAGAYGGACVVVDIATGNDTTGRAYLRGGTVGPPVLTLDKAMTLIKATNNSFYGHNDCGGGTIYLTNGSYGLTVNTAMGTTPIPLEITVYPGVDRASVTITNAGKEPVGGPIVWRNLTLSSTAALNYWGSTFVWFDNCLITNTSSGTFQYGSHPWGFVNCTIAASETWAFQPRAGQNAPCCFIWGSVINGTVSYQPAYLFVGNTLPGPVNQPFINQNYTTVPATPYARGPIWWGNKMLKVRVGSNGIWFADTNMATGLLLIGNVIEKTNTADARIGFLWADDNYCPVSNVVLANNTFLGDRLNYCYNDSGASAWYKTHFYAFNNYLEGKANKSDTFGTANGNRVGNWASLWCVGHRGNIVNALKAWGGEEMWPGLYARSVQYGGTNYARFVARLATDGTNALGGGGDYRLRSDSPMLQLAPDTSWSLYDLEANARGNLDPPGAYSSASPRKGGFLF